MLQLVSNTVHWRRMNTGARRIPFQRTCSFSLCSNAVLVVRHCLLRCPFYVAARGYLLLEICSRLRTVGSRGRVSFVSAVPLLRHSLAALLRALFLGVSDSTNDVVRVAFGGFSDLEFGRMCDRLPADVGVGTPALLLASSLRSMLFDFAYSVCPSIMTLGSYVVFFIECSNLFS